MIDGSVLQSVQRCFEKKSRVVVKMVVILHHNISDAPQVDLKMFSFLFQKKSKTQFRNAHSMVITARIIS